MAATPTLRDQGIDAVFTTWRNAIAPKGVPRAQVMFWEDALAKAVKSEEWQKDLERNFWTANFMTGAPMHAFLDQQTVLYRKIFDALGLSKPVAGRR